MARGLYEPVYRNWPPKDIEETSKMESGLETPETKRWQEGVRGALAFVLIFYLMGWSGLSSWLLISKSVEMADLTTLLGIFVVPVIAIVSSALGYYYGQKSRRN